MEIRRFPLLKIAGRKKSINADVPSIAFFGCVGFTLIELLVVIAIIAILAARCFFPALARAKDQG